MALQQSIETDENSAGPCPECGGLKTRSGRAIEGIDNPAVGFCMHCGFLWCTECGSPLRSQIPCPHWEVCEYCGEEKDEDGECEFATRQCDIIRSFLFTRSWQDAEESKNRGDYGQAE